MKRWLKGINFMMMTLSILLIQANFALARAGGGKGGSLEGSSGSSFSGGGISGGGIPGGTFSGGSVPRGTFSGGSFPSGGLPTRGFGSFFPFFWFGGGATGGGSFFGGLFNLLFLLLVGYLIYKVIRILIARSKGKNPPKGWENPSSIDYGDSTDGGYRESNMGNQPVDITGKVISNEANLRRFEKAMAFTRDNMRYYAETFPRWDRDYLLGRIRQVFFWIQDGWTRQDLSGGEEYLTQELLDRYKKDLAAMKARGERNVIKEPVLQAEDIQFIYSKLNETEQYFVAMVAASLIDYTVNRSGTLIAGEDDNRLHFTEFWKFRWDGQRWVLAEILQEDTLEVAKIARGDEY